MKHGSDRLAKMIPLMRVVNATLLLLFAFGFLLYPGFVVAWNLRDPGIRSDSIPRFAWTLFRDAATQVTGPQR